MTNTKRSTQITVKGALLVAIAFVFTYFEFPIIPSVPWLKLDFSLVPLLLGALALGPGTGVLLTALLQILLTMTKSSTGGVGEIANFIVIGTMILAVSLVYRRNRTTRGLVAGLGLGTIAFTFAAVLANQFILVPLFFPGEFPGGEGARQTYLYQAVPLFNLIKGLATSAFSLLAYSKLARFLNVESMKTRSMDHLSKMTKAVPK